MKYTSINIKQTLAFTAAVVALGFLASCQRDAIVPDSLSGQELVPVTLKASMVQTKVTYDETSKRNLQPSWEKNDKVIGFDENAKTYEFEVSAVETDGSATLTGTAPAKCTLHLIYLCGATASSIKVEGKTASVAVDYRNQAGDKTLPAVMLANGELNLGTGEFHFRNAGAVIGIDAVMGVPSGKTISKVTIHGDNLSSATIALDGSGLALTNEGSTGESISTATLTGITVTDGVGNLSTPILIAVPAGAKVNKITLGVDTREYAYSLATPATLTANDYTYVAGKTFHKVPPEGALPGLFSVGAGKHVHFSQGNLTYNVADSKWSFYDNQYDCASAYSSNLISLFTWGYGTWSTNPSTVVYNENHKTDGEPLSDAEDWGSRIDDKGSWRTPTIAEWQYLISNASERDGLYAIDVKVMGNEHCFILYPDGYDKTKVVSNGDKTSYDSQEEWTAAQNSGVVCLPAAGARTGETISNYGDKGYYWSNSGYSDTFVSGVGNLAIAGDLEITCTEGTRGVSAAVGFRYLGGSVRLVTDAE